MATILAVDDRESNRQHLNLRLEALLEIGRELNVSQDVSCLLTRYCRAARELVGSACAAACITDKTGREIRHYCGSGGQATAAGDSRPAFSMDDAVTDVLAGRICRRGQEWTGDAAALGCRPDGPAVNSYLIIPIATPSGTYGWLGLANKVGYPEFTADDERLSTTLAGQLAVGYENSRLFEHLKRRAEDLEHEVAEIRHAAEKYRMVVDQASDGIAIADERGDYLEVNPRMLDMLGYTREEFLDMHMQDLIPKADQAQDPISVRRLVPGEVTHKECRLICNGGSFLSVEIGMSRLEDGRVQAIVRDVAERKRVESELRQHQKLEAVGRLAGGVAHDFNNLLTVILGHSDLALSAQDLSQKRRPNLEGIRDAAARAAVLTSQLLALSRKQVLQPRVLDVSASVRNLTKTLGTLMSSDIEIITRHEGESCRAKVDPRQLDQVLLNLVLNARDAMPLGGKMIIETANCRLDQEQISRQTEVPPGDYVMLSVSDTGSGMDAETRSHLFEPFFTTKAPGKGTGLGLSTVYGIVRQSGGYISVYSEPGHGAIVKIYLPRVLEAGESVRTQDENGRMPAGSETILIAEDEEQVRLLVAAVLVQQGYKVIQAGDGQQALEIAKRHSGKIHLLLTDIMMPRMGGPELVEHIQRARPSIRVLFCSGYAGHAAMEQGIVQASTPFLPKPFTPCTLALKVREVLDTDAGSALPLWLSVSAERSNADDRGVLYATQPVTRGVGLAAKAASSSS
jgi:PAS domain S-box-containing protein